MFLLKLISRALPAIAASLAIAAATGAQAYEGQQGSTARANGNLSPACESARIAARFEFERQRTEGNVSPFFQASTPVECSSRMASDDKAGGDLKTAADASSRAPVIVR